MEEEEGLKARSFRHEDYNTRRAFLRSYPLQWDDDETGEEAQTDARESAAVMSMKRGKAAASVKKKLIMVFHWGEGKCLILRRFKEKFVYYLVVCHGYSSFGFKSSDKMLDVK